MRKCLLGSTFLITAALLSTGFLAQAADDDLPAAAKTAMKKAATFYRHQVAVHGGYVYYYSPDLSRRLGEGVARPNQIWVQPPGTPTVGMAYLAAWRATRDDFYRDAAREAASALIPGQFSSGGWTNSVEIDPQQLGIAPLRQKDGNSTLDDGISQSAIQFMAQLDQALDFQDAAVHESAQAGLNGLLQAQFANGAFPQVWRGPAPSVQGKKASFPDYDWRTEGRIKNYWDMFTLNDGLAGTVTTTLLAAHVIYKDDKYLAAAAKLGDFLILAQLPEPQPAWSQQYNYDMQPIWARRFEPAAVTGSESQDVLETLLKIYHATGDKKYLEPIPRALAWLKRSQLPDGRLARYYELQTNKPLYMNRQGDTYSLTYDDSQLPSHYGWKVASRAAAIEAAYQAALAGGRGQEPGARSQEPGDRSQDAEVVRKIIAQLDDQGRWISTFAGEPLSGQPKFQPGEKYLHSGVFSRNLETLSEFLAATK
ncbi:MAG: pectate lyase [Pirellulaceae bacterium]|nr:pectate lyase [Pirellulaceae bacterium]